MNRRLKIRDSRMPLTALRVESQRSSRHSLVRSTTWLLETDLRLTVSLLQVLIRLLLFHDSYHRATSTRITLNPQHSALDIPSISSTLCTSAPRIMDPTRHRSIAQKVDANSMFNIQYPTRCSPIDLTWYVNASPHSMLELTTACLDTRRFGNLNRDIRRLEA